MEKYKKSLNRKVKVELFLISVIFTITLISSVSALSWNSTFNDKIVGVWQFNDNSESVFGLMNLIPFSPSFSQINFTNKNINGKAGQFNDTANMNISNAITDKNLNFTINSSLSIWFNNSGSPVNNLLIEKKNGWYIATNYPANNCRISELTLTPITVPCPSNKTVHLVVVRNDTEINVYVNGTLYNNTATSMSNSNKDISLGNGNFRGLNNFIGFMDEMYLWNRSLRNSEVRDLYNSGSGIFYMLDSVYPQFTDFFEATPPDSTPYMAGRTFYFNATVENTNGTVILTMENSTGSIKQYYANNITNKYYAIAVDLQPDMYILNWSAYGNGSLNRFNFTDDFIYNVLPTSTILTLNYPIGFSNVIRPYRMSCTFNSTDANLNATNIRRYIANDTGIFNLYSTKLVSGMNSQSIDNNVLLTSKYNNMSWYCNSTLTDGSEITTVKGYYNVTFYLLNNLTQNFTNQVTNSKTFSINFSYDSITYPIATVQLCSNFTYTTPFTCVNMNGQTIGNNVLFTKTLDLPNQTGLYGFYYDINFANMNGSSRNVFECVDGLGGTCIANLSDINLNECNSTYPTKTLNFTAWNQDTLTRVNPFDFLSTLIYFLGNGTTYKTISFNNLSVMEKTLCINPNYTYKISGVVQYVNSSYQTGNFFFNRYNINNISQNINLYFMNASLSTSFIILVQSTSQVPLQNYFVYIYRYYPATDSSLLVQTVKTDSVGKGIGFFITETVSYSFIITDSFGNIVLQTGNRKIIPETTPYTLIFTVGEGTPNPYSYFSNLSQITYTLGWNKGTETVSFLYSDSNSSFIYSRLQVSYLNSTGDNPIICNVTSTDSTGTLLCDLSTNLSGTYVAEAFVSRGGVEYKVNQINFDIFGTNGGMLGIFGGFCIILICAFALAWNEIAGIVLINFGVIAVQLLGLINFGIIGISAIIGISVLIVIFLERS